MPRPTAAAALYPHHLKSDERPTQQQQRASSPLAAAMYPALAPQPKPPINPDRESLLRHLRELNRRIDERMQREGNNRNLKPTMKGV